MTATPFREAYGVLQRHAETLRNQQEPNIDDLLNIVTESVGAYKVCKDRIDAVEKALEQALGNVGVESSAAAPSDASEYDSPEQHPNHPANLDSEDDLPF
ncbi:exodeoxyribonuclease VII small subunit [Propionivibrio sp.]|uniref:exodeoxyribonuclease VII small subunit n=1 Tax=Propionivibrio sp. TaxID=2212460 RepID=UPI003BF0203C